MTKQTPLLNRVVGYSFVLYLLFIVLPYAQLSSYQARVEAEPEPLWLLLGLASIGGALLLHVYFSAGVTRLYLSRSAWWMILFFGWAIVSSVASVDPIKSIVSGAIGLAVTLIFAYGGRYSFERGGRTLAVGAFIYFLFLVLLMAMFPVVFGKTVGGIQPNQFAKAGIVVMVLAVVAQHKWRSAAIVFAVACSAISTSRGGLVFIATFLLVYVATNVSVATIIRWGAMVLATVAGLWLVELLTGLRTVSFIYSDVLLVDSSVYGIGSGLTGRTEHWETGLSVIWEHPVVGNGYNTRAGVDEFDLSIVNVHQGYLNLMLDSGLVGVVVFLGAAISSVRECIAAVRATPENGAPRAILGFVIAYLALMFIDPFYLNLGFPLSVIMLFFLSNSAVRLNGVAVSKSPA